MPWTVKDVDGFKKGLNTAQKKKWVSIANGILKDCQSSGGKDCEGKAIRIANSKFDLVDINSTWTFDDLDAHDEFFGLKKDTEKKGGSNAGKYKKGPFCGPSGGAPKGTYPVNTKGRAVAAIAYARHAPNPSGIKACVCRHWPGLNACKKKEKQQMAENMVVEKIPKGALRFVDEGCHAFALKADGADAVPKLQMTAYNGKIIKGHWYWGDLAMDLEGMKFPAGKFPILENHMTDRKVGFHKGKPDTSENKLELVPEKTQFVSTEAAEEFIKLSSEGFPYQASVYAKPTEIHRLMKDETAEVNGFTMRGPGTIWRKSEFKEASVCVFGWDNQTNASAFSKTETEDVEYENLGGDAEVTLENKSGMNLNIKIEEEVKEMPKTVQELQEKYPELVQKLTDDLTATFEQEKGNLQAEVTRLTDEGKKKEDRIDQLEKKDIIRTEREIRSEAEKIVNSKLAATDIPERLYDKIRRLVKHDKFVKNDALDTEAFATFVDQEIKDFEDAGVTNTVLGRGGTGRTEEDDPEKLAQKKVDDEDEEAVDSMYHMAMGTKPEKKDEK